jgi:wobble nucleotide-excising tRNase
MARLRKKKKMDGDTANDECLSGKKRMKIETFLPAIDQITQQLQSRFSDQNVAFMKQLSYFTPASLLGETDVRHDDVKELCEQYNLSTTDVCNELKDFRSNFKICQEANQLESTSDAPG